MLLAVASSATGHPYYSYDRKVSIFIIPNHGEL